VRAFHTHSNWFAGERMKNNYFGVLEEEEYMRSILTFLASEIIERV
jgi:hypothetical protein